MRSGRAIALLAASLVLTACGGGESSAPISPQSAPDSAMATVQSASPKARVTWSPATLAITLMQGTTTSVSALLTMNEAIDSPSLFVVPELENLLFASIRASARLSPGQVPVGLLLRASATTPPGTYEGTVHLRSGTRTIPQTLKVSIQVIAPSNVVVAPGVAHPSADRIGKNSQGQTLIRDELVVIIDATVPDAGTRIREIATLVGGVIVGSVPGSNVFQLRIVGAEPDALPGLADAIRPLSGVKTVSRHFPVRPLEAPPGAYFPDDRLFSGNWEADFNQQRVAGINRSLEFLRAPEAWDQFRPSANLPPMVDVTGAKRIAIIDWGFDRHHPDFADNDIRHFATDFTEGKSFVYENTRPGICEQGDPRGHGTEVAGTLCALGNNGKGATGLAWRCSVDLYELPTAPDPSLLILYNLLSVPRWVRDENSSPSLWALEQLPRMIKAVDNGARIVNMSYEAGEANCRSISDIKDRYLGQVTDEKQKQICTNRASDPMSGITRIGNDFTFARMCPMGRKKAADESDAIFEKAIEHAIETGKDVLWIAGAGNESSDAKLVSPASLVRKYPRNVIVVAAAELADRALDVGLEPVELAYYSNFGALVDVAAPVPVTTTIPRLCARVGDLTLCEDDVLRLGNSTELGPYRVDFDGTSAAAPQVAALAALVWAKHPYKSAGDVKDCIVRGARMPVQTNRALQEFLSKNPSSPVDSDYTLIDPKFKVIDAARAVDCQAPSISIAPVSKTVDVNEPASFSFVAKGTPPLKYRWKRNGVDIPDPNTFGESPFRPLNAQLFASYTTPPNTAFDNGAVFTVVVSNDFGEVTSAPAQLKVNPAVPPPPPTVQPLAKSRLEISEYIEVDNGYLYYFTNDVSKTPVVWELHRVDVNSAADEVLATGTTWASRMFKFAITPTKIAIVAVAASGYGTLLTADKASTARPLVFSPVATSLQLPTYIVGAIGETVYLPPGRMDLPPYVRIDLSSPQNAGYVGTSNYAVTNGTVDAPYIYFLDTNFYGQISRINTVTNAAEVVVPPYSPVFLPITTFTLDANNVYVGSMWSYGSMTIGNPGLFRISKTNSTDISDRAPGLITWVIAATGGKVYFVEGPDTARMNMRSVPATAGPMSAPIYTGALPYSTRTDGTALYWMDVGGYAPGYYSILKLRLE